MRSQWKKVRVCRWRKIQERKKMFWEKIYHLVKHTLIEFHVDWRPGWSLHATDIIILDVGSVDTYQMPMADCAHNDIVSLLVGRLSIALRENATACMIKIQLPKTKHGEGRHCGISMTRLDLLLPIPHTFI